MAVSDRRMRRIQERIKEELSEILLYEVADPRLQGVTVTDVEVDRELAYADIYVSSLESERKREILEGFERAKGFLRTLLAQRIPLRTFPRLRFHWDDTPERAARLGRLFELLKAEREQRMKEMAAPSGDETETHSSEEEGETQEMPS